MTRRGGRLAACRAAAALTLWPLPLACHTVQLGPLTIVHPAIVAQAADGRGMCIHLTIVNHGAAVERLMAIRIRGHIGDTVEAAGRPAQHLPLAIRPGGTLELRDGICLFVRGLSGTFEPDMAVVAGEIQFGSSGWSAIAFMVDAARP